MSAPRDQSGVKVVTILYNLGDIYCILDASNKEANEKHHDKKYNTT